MSLIKNNALVGASGQGGYTIDRSLRFRSSASAYLSRTPASAGNRKTWTWSGWVKRGQLGATQTLFSVGTGGTNARSILAFISDDTIEFGDNPTGSAWYEVITSAVYRDASAWYHVVAVWDSSNSTSSDRLRLYVNGIRITSFGTAGYPPQNTDSVTNTVIRHWAGQYAGGALGAYFDGYLTEVNFIDGQALDPTSFGEYNSDTGVWQPIKYTGTYGTNGFYLNFSDNSTTTTLGYDTSGNGNNWTANNISVTSGATYDSMTDTPTPYANGGNYAVLNSISPSSSGGSWYTQNGNLSLVRNGGGWITGIATIGVTSGKWYWEVIPQNTGGLFTIGLAKDGYDWTTYLGSDAFGWSYEGGGGVKYTNGSSSAYGATYTTNDVIGVAFDADAGTLTFYKNNTSQGQAFSGLTSGPYYPASGVSNLNTTAVFNFGQRPFAYTPPAGFKSLNTYNLPDSTIEDGSQYFNATTYTGNGTTQSIVNSGGMQPDLVWFKVRDTTYSNTILDSARNSGANALFTDGTNAESVNYANGQITSFNSNGVTVNGGIAINQSPRPYVAWQWKAGGSAVSNTDGSITSTVSANLTSGFSIVTYTGTGVTTETVGHGLGAVPAMVIVKNRDTSTNNGHWVTYHQSLAANTQLALNLDIGAAASSAYFGGGVNTSPTSSVFSFANGSSNQGNVNESGDNYVAYCFAEVPGFSKFGSYTGNGSSDGSFVYTGFRPAFVMFKRTDSTNDWQIYDSTREPANVTNDIIFANKSDAEVSNSTNNNFDLLSNGFKLRNTSGSQNASGGTYIFMAFAETDFANALAR